MYSCSLIMEVVVVNTNESGSQMHVCLLIGML